jgi:hypothetical protein
LLHPCKGKVFRCCEVGDDACPPEAKAINERATEKSPEDHPQDHDAAGKAGSCCASGGLQDEPRHRQESDDVADHRESSRPEHREEGQPLRRSSPLGVVHEVIPYHRSTAFTRLNLAPRARVRGNTARVSSSVALGLDGVGRIHMRFPRTSLRIRL